MSKDTLAKANKCLQESNYRSERQWLNNKLDDVEVEIMNYMRTGGYQATEFVHALIGERGNIKYKLKDVSDKLNGKE
jgi:hypothetical protein